MNPKRYYKSIQPEAGQGELVLQSQEEKAILWKEIRGEKLGHERISAAVGRAPGVRPVLRKLADKVARGVALPARFSVGELGYAAQRELEGLLGIVGNRTSTGRVSFPLPDELREPSAWHEVIAFFRLVRGDDVGDEDVFKRLKLLLPETAEALDLLAGREDVARFVADRENGRDWMRLFRHVVEKRLLRDDSSAITLSQLGSDCFGDSKKLRTGALRRQLAQILGVFGDMDPLDERAVFARFGIVDNPYTTSVTVFAPFVIQCCNGKTFDFPYLLFRQGLACQLPLETISTITHLEWRRESDPLITTSENAAPFAGLVKRGIPCLYTEGYPNTCVTGLLSLFHASGVRCVHEGDADLDGFRIAGEVAKNIHLERVVAADALSFAVKNDFPVGISLTDAQRSRAEAFLAENPDFESAGAIRKMLDWGRWVEQESFESLLGRKGR